MSEPLPELFSHPFAAFCWKALIALYERDIAFEYRQVGGDFPDNQARLERLWPVAQFPVLVHRGRTLVETAVIIDYLDVAFDGAPPMIPKDRIEALEARMLDGVIDDYVAAPMQRIVADFMRPPAEREVGTIAQAKATLDKSYDWLDARLAGRSWGAGDDFGLADCAAAPALFYADWVHPIGNQRPRLASYRAKLLARPSVKRVVDDARPYRHYFPPGAPDRD
ncbi:MAG: glutathione S-transferase family protein [Steroidobacteraceae bacterium]